jgi:RNA recognition motif-containing protein
MAKRLFVGNLAYSINEADLRDLFSGSGDITEVKVVLDRETGRARGFAFVEMATEEGAGAAIQNLNGRDLQGRALTVREAEERGSGGGRGGAGGGGGRSSQRRW